MEAEHVLPKHTRRNRPVLIFLAHPHFPTSGLSEGTRRVSRRFCTNHASPCLACNVPRTPSIYPPMCCQFVQLASCLTLPSMRARTLTALILSAFDADLHHATSFVSQAARRHEFFRPALCCLPADRLPCAPEHPSRWRGTRHTG